MKLKAGETLNIKFSKYEKSSLTSITTLKFENWTLVNHGIFQTSCPGKNEGVYGSTNVRKSRGRLCSLLFSACLSRQLKTRSDETAGTHQFFLQYIVSRFSRLGPSPAKMYAKSRQSTKWNNSYLEGLHTK